MFRFFKLTICFFAFSFLQADPIDPLADRIEELIIDYRQTPSTSIPIVGIAGISGVGKTSFSKELQKKMEERKFNCVVLSMDDFNAPYKERKKTGEEWSLRHFQSDPLHQMLLAIAQGQRQFVKPVYYQLLGEMGEEFLDLEETDLIILEGIYALCSDPPLQFAQYCLVRIYMEAELADTYRWKLQREEKKTTPRTPEEFMRHMKAILIDFSQNISPSKKNATFIVHKSSDHQCMITEVKELE